MAAAPLFAVLATRALDASKAARAAERRAPRARDMAALGRAAGPSRRLDRSRARGMDRLRRTLIATLSAVARPRP